MYFNLVRTFGDVPLVLEVINNPSEGYAYGREATGNVYEQIVSDLREAGAVLPEQVASAEIGRATRGAAMALLGKVYLTLGQWDLAAQTLKALIGMGTYQLLPNYANLFGASNENSRESIFEVQFKKGSSGEGSPYTNQFAPIGSGTAVTGLGNPLGQNIPTDAIVAAYETGDLRKNASMQTTYTLNGNTVTHNYVAKYLGQPAANLDSDNNWIVLRYADVLLMYAEALNELGFAANGEAFLYLNQVRKRAGLPLYGEAVPDWPPKRAITLIRHFKSPHRRRSGSRSNRSGGWSWHSRDIAGSIWSGPTVRYLYWHLLE